MPFVVCLPNALECPFFATKNALIPRVIPDFAAQRELAVRAMRQVVRRVLKEKRAKMVCARRATKTFVLLGTCAEKTLRICVAQGASGVKFLLLRGSNVTMGVNAFLRNAC